MEGGWSTSEMQPALHLPSHIDSMSTGKSSMPIKPASARLTPLWGPCSLGVRWATSIRLLIAWVQAILQPCALCGSEVWAPADAHICPLQGLQNPQRSFLCHAYRVKNRVPIAVIFQGLSVTWWHDIWLHAAVTF